MIELELSNEAFEEVRDKFIVAGLIADEPREWDEDSKPFTVGGITFKEYKYVPTPEDIARQEEFRKTPFGQLMEQSIEHMASKMLSGVLAPNSLLNAIYSETKEIDVLESIGTTLRIRLPRDYFVKIGDEWLDK